MQRSEAGSGGGRPLGGGSSGMAPAYPHERRFSFSNIILFLALLFVFKNILSNDYRNEGISFLRQAGKSEDEIDRYIPETAAEKKLSRTKSMDEISRLRDDVAQLRSEIKELKAKVMGEDISAFEQESGAAKNAKKREPAPASKT